MSKAKPAVQTKQKLTNSETKPMQQEPALPAQYENPWLEAAAEAGSEFGKLLKYLKGEWQIGDDVIPEGTEYIAYIDELARAWIKFEDQSVVDRRIVKVRDGKLPSREELGDTDSSNWETDDNGNPRDCWALHWLLPMAPVEAEADLTVFATRSKGGIGAIGVLCKVYGRTSRHGLLPIVALKTRSYKHKKYGKIETPDLPIVGWHGTATQPAQSAPHNGTADFDDRIPY